MAVRTKQLFAGVAAGVLAPIVYTCPAGETTIVKEVVIFNSTGAAAVVTLLVNGTANANIIYRASCAASVTTQLLERFIVLQPGDELRAATPLAGVTVWGFGSQLEGVAD